MRPFVPASQEQSSNDHQARPQLETRVLFARRRPAGVRARVARGRLRKLPSNAPLGPKKDPGKLGGALTSPGARFLKPTLNLDFSLNYGEEYGLVMEPCQGLFAELQDSVHERG